MGLLSAMLPVEPSNAASPKAEDAAVGRHQPVAAATGRRAMPTMGLLSAMLPVEPWNDASPKLKMPPSDATSQ